MAATVKLAKEHEAFFRKCAAVRGRETPVQLEIRELFHHDLLNEIDCQLADRYLDREAIAAGENEADVDVIEEIQQVVDALHELVNMTYRPLRNPHRKSLRQLHADVSPLIEALSRDETADLLPDLRATLAKIEKLIAR